MRVHIRQEEVVLCVLDFLKQAGLARTMRTLEQETGLVVDEYGNDLMFLRGLVLDGAWRDAENFVAPLAKSQPPQTFDAQRVLFEMRRQVSVLQCRACYSPWWPCPPLFFFFFVLSFGVYIFPFFLPFPSFSLPSLLSLLSFFSYFLPSFLSSLFFSYVTFLSVLLQLSVLSVLSCILLGLDSAPRLCVLSLLLPAHSRKTLPPLSSSIPPPPSHSRRTARVLISVKHDTSNI
jgi:hypothetical protein